MPENTVTLPRPHTAQLEVLENRARFNVVACGRRWGKTKMGGSLAIEGALQGYPVGWFAPTYKTLGDALTEIRGRTKSVRSITYKADERLLVFPNGGSIEFWSTEPRQSGDDESEVARGRKYKRVIYDEAAHARRLKADWTKAIRATLMDYEGDAWLFSTPKGQNYFHKMYLRGVQGEPGWASFSMPTMRNPHISPEEIETARRDLPADAFEQEFEARFLANAANPFTIDAIRRNLAPLSTAPTVCYGVDLASSQDYTVVWGIDDDGRCTMMERWQGTWEYTEARLVHILGQTPAHVDATGVGKPIVERLLRHNPLVEGCVFTPETKHRLVSGVVVALQQDRFTVPEGVAQGEFESFEYRYSPGGRVSYTAPDGLHDDCVCAGALALDKLARLPRVHATSWAQVDAARGRNADIFASFAERRKDPDWGFDD